MMSRLFKTMVLCMAVALYIVNPAWPVKTFKISNYGNGHQIWFEVEDYDERDPDTDGGFALRDEPGAFGRSITQTSGDDGAYMMRYEFDISMAGGAGGTWYFWGRVIIPDNRSSFLVVEGDPGDASVLPIVLPTGNLDNSRRVFEANLETTWAWGVASHGSGHTKTLQDGLNTMYLLSRETNGILDVFMWTDDPDYVPTDEDYINAAYPVAGTALKPSPASGAADVPRDGMLSWAPGEFAATHHVYFGDNFDDVNAADLSSPLLIGKNLDVTSLALDRLEFGQTYYWRVDEVNAAPDDTVIRGNVWSFEVEPYAVLVENVTAIASSSSNGQGPENTVNGSGLDISTGFHSTDNLDMWASSQNQDPTEPVSIQFEFDQVRLLHTMKVWNANSLLESVLGFGFKEAIITYSMDGLEWTRLGGDDGVVQFARTPGGDYAAQIVDMTNVTAKFVKITGVSNWSAYFNQYSLSEVQFEAIPVIARTPNPGSGTQGVDPRSDQLSWRAGRQAGQHDVYVSADPNVLGAAHTVSTNSLALNSLDLALDTTFYWQVDEVNEAQTPSTWTGNLWSFTTVDSFAVDDFERYNNLSPDRPFQHWLDGYGYSADEFYTTAYNGNGTGAGIGHDIWSPSSPYFGGDLMETGSTFSDSGQAMPFYYRNTEGVASETQHKFATGQDWTVSGLQTLSIAFRGTGGNTGSLYIKINNVKIPYDLTAADIGLAAWQVWNIDLTKVSGLKNVTSLSIGVDGSGASGMVLIDDIKLYAKPGELINPVSPNTAGLLAQYSFEGNANDISGHGLNGSLTPVLATIAAPGASGQGSAVQLQLGGYVDLGNFASLNFGTGDWTIAAWFKTSMTGTGDANKGTILGKGGDSTGGHRYALIMSETVEGVVTLVTDDDVTKIVVDSSTPTNDGQWHSVAAQRQGTDIRLFIDGQLESSSSAAPAYDLSGTSQHNAYIGAVTNHASGTLYKMFNGSIDNVALYNRALSAEEILWLAGRTTPIHKPF